MALTVRKWPWPAGLLGLIVLTILCVGIWERDLRSDGAAALSGIGLANLGDGVDVSGQTVTLTGTVDSETARVAAEQAVGGVEFVRRVENKLVVSADPAPEPADTPPTAVPAPTVDPTLRGTVANGTIVLEGLVPTRAVADEIVVAAEAEYGTGNVTDQLIVQEDVIEADWLANGSIVSMLGAMPDGGFEVGSGVVTLRGEVPDQDTYDTLAAQAALSGLTVDNQLTIAAVEEIGELDFPTISFEPNSSVIAADSLADLDEAAEILIANPTVQVEVGGHTDSDGNADTNLDLSQARADAVVAYLVDQGVNATNLTAVAYGEDQPIVDNSTAAAKERNRRVEFKIIGGSA